MVSKDSKVRPLARPTLKWVMQKRLWFPFLINAYYTDLCFVSFLPLQDNGLTPLMLAARDNKHNIVEKLLELGAVVTDRDKASTLRHHSPGQFS